MGKQKPLTWEDEFMFDNITFPHFTSSKLYVGNFLFVLMDASDSNYILRFTYLLQY